MSAENPDSESYVLYQQARSRMDASDWSGVIELFAASARHRRQGGA